MSHRRTVVITGGASGIGAATCRLMAAAGERIAVLDLDGDGAANLVESLNGDGHIAIRTDVSERSQVDAAITTIQADLGPIEVLINVAGWDRFIKFVDTTPDFWHKVIDINYGGVLNTCHAVVPEMIEQGVGRIVNVASDAARVGSSLESVYAGAKGAVVSFSKSLAREVARSGVSVNVVCPGPTDTPLLTDLAADLPDGEKFVGALERAVPMGRLAQPEDIAPAIVFLASDGARYITGQTLSVSGGLTMA